MNPNIKLKGQAALVTGANSGIGKGVALALARDGAKVVVNYISRPEAADDVVKQITKEGGTAIALKAELLTLIPYGRIGMPDDIGKLAVWLASDESDYITGTTVFIDGGMTLYPGFSTNG